MNWYSKYLKDLAWCFRVNIEIIIDRVLNIFLNAPVNKRKNNICNWLIINQNPESEDPDVTLERAATLVDEPAKYQFRIERNNFFAKIFYFKNSMFK